jgi:hypothetical protein
MCIQMEQYIEMPLAKSDFMHGSATQALKELIL